MRRKGNGLLPGFAALRLDEATIARIDAIIPALSTRGRDANRSEALRWVIRVGLDYVEQQHADKLRALARAKTQTPGA